MEIGIFIQSKIDYIYKLIQSSSHHLDKSKTNDLFSNSDMNLYFKTLRELKIRTDTLYSSLDNENSNDNDTNTTLDEIQSILDKLSSIFSQYGADTITHVIELVYGKDYDYLQHNANSENDPILQKSKMSLLEMYVTPTGYINTKSNKNSVMAKRSMHDYENKTHIECCEFNGLYKSLINAVSGIKIVFHNTFTHTTILIHGIVENVPLLFIKDNLFLDKRLDEIKTHLLQNIILSNHETTECRETTKKTMERWVNTLTLKDILIYSKEELLKKYITMKLDVQYVKQNEISEVIKKFSEIDILSKRNMLINLFTFDTDNEVQYVAYLLYDLLSPSSSETDTQSIDQQVLYKSLPWIVKQYFKDTMINTIKFYDETTTKYENSKVTLEQQVLLLKVPETVKDRAIVKLKEIKGKSDDQGTKAKQYLEGLVKIPFGKYKKEPILKIIDSVNTLFCEILDNTKKIPDVPKRKYTIYEISKHLQMIKSEVLSRLKNDIENYISNASKSKLMEFANRLGNTDVKLTTKPKLQSFIKSCFIQPTNETVRATCTTNKISSFGETYLKIDNVEKDTTNMEHSMNEIRHNLNQSIYGHHHAKSQIMKIISQWINGEQDGYCFGFEGSPGVGKTSLAKYGLAKCLQDEHGNSRPFSFIALGGSSNGSTLEGHNYTYVNSTWGKIVDILMESKCMNPIIYIDELDKVSKTEQGREIIGILMHLIDTTQNDEFQDRYFNGIHLDLSKALFIFSYNDPDQIDRILLDRIHRIKFENLSTKEKIVIVKDYILPSLNTKMGFDQTVELTDGLIEYMIDNYTMEPGVRKLKEILFDLYGEINIELLKPSALERTFPITVTDQDLGKTFLKKYKKLQEKKIHDSPLVGIINGMWANNLGKGGILPIEVHFFPTSNFLELRLTGLQGDVMKESMNVAKTLAWNLTSKECKQRWIADFKDTMNQGIHIHCPEGATSKDGPSAGCAITLAIYSLLNQVFIPNTISITGEINLQGEIMAIGGLESKIVGSVRAGVKTVYFPSSNSSDFEEIHLKYKDVLDKHNVNCIPVKNIQEALDKIVNHAN